MNATPELRRQLKLDGKLVGLGLDLPEVAVDDEGRWQVTTPVTGMLTGNYAVHLRALQNGQPVAELDLPMIKPEPRPGRPATTNACVVPRRPDAPAAGRVHGAGRDRLRGGG